MRIKGSIVGFLLLISLLTSPLAVVGQGRHERLQKQLYLKTKEQTTNELSSSLHESSEAFTWVVQIASQSGGALHRFNIRSPLADCRVSKLFEKLECLNAQKAEILARELYSRAFHRYKSQWANAGILPSCELYSMDAHFFLCCYFCQPAVVLEKLDEWDEWHSLNSKNRGRQFTATAGIDKAYKLNLLMNMIMRSRKLSIDEMNAWLKEKVELEERLELKLESLRASDYIVATSSEPIAQIPVLSRYPTAVVFNDELYDTAVKVLREELLSVSDEN